MNQMQTNNDDGNGTTSPAAAEQVSPIPEGLLRVAEEFARADKHGIAPDLSKGAKSLVYAAWDGSLCSGVALPGGGIMNKIPLADAIHRSTAELDAAAMAYMACVTAEIGALLSSPGAFDANRFSQDVVTAFTNLKNLRFDGMRTVDYDNIQGALSKNENAWRSGPHKNEVFVIQQFCVRMVELAVSLQQRTGKSFEEVQSASSSNNNDTTQAVVANSNAKPPPDAPRQLNYESSQRIVDGPRWPQCVNGTYDWASLFGKRMQDDDDDDDGPWLTPRMAACIHHVAVIDGESMFEDFECGSFFHPRLPKIARPFYKNSKSWRLAFRDCYLRIALRLQKGMKPQPNCTAEEMAFHNIMHRAPDADDAIGDEINTLPSFPNDDDFALVRDCAVEDEDVLMLFDKGDRGYDDSDDDEPINVDNPIMRPGAMADFMLGTGGTMMRTANLHPKDWFIAFRNERFNDHL